MLHAFLMMRRATANTAPIFYGFYVPQGFTCMSARQGVYSPF
jgi:hypothetical protein